MTETANAKKPERPVDPDAIFVALLVAPGSFSRNRSFELFARDGVKKAQRRAQTLATALRHLSQRADATHELRVSPTESTLAYSVPSMGLRRVLRLLPLDVSVFRVLAAQLEIPGVTASAEDRALVDGTLARLAPRAASKNLQDTSV